MSHSRRWLVGLAVSSAAMALAFWGIQPGRLRATLAEANYVYLIPAAIILILGLLAKARSWQVLLGREIRFGHAFDALNEGFLLNSVLPLRLGELARAYLVAQRGRLSTATALASVLLERLIDLGITTAGLLVALPYVTGPDWAENLAWLAALVFVVGLAVVLLLIRQKRRVLDILRRLPRRGILGIFKEVEAFAEGLGNLLSAEVLLRALCPWGRGSRGCDPFFARSARRL